MSVSTEQWLDEVSTERVRQEQLRVSGKFKRTCASNEMSNAERLAVLAEEFGEVARCVCESIESPLTPTGTHHLREELVQVAAVCIAWLESDCGGGK